VQPGEIWNMDQTMVRFDMPASRTNNTRGARTIRIRTSRAEKKGFTVALAASAAGAKLPAFMIFRERNGRLGDRVRRGLTVPDNVHINASTNGWMTNGLLHAWLKDDFDRSASKRLLVIDR